MSVSEMDSGVDVCKHCGDTIDDETRFHWVVGPRHDGWGHEGYCCDCFDLLCGEPIEQINEKRMLSGKSPLRPILTHT